MSTCWHAHDEVLAELVTRFPSAPVVTAIATDTAPMFHDRALATASLTLGSHLFPVTAPECCECDHSDYADEFDSGAVVLSGDAMRPNVSVDYVVDHLDRVLAEQ